MASLRLFLKDFNSKKETPISYYISISKNHRLRGSTYLKIKPKYWDKKKQRIKNIAEISKAIV